MKRLILYIFTLVLAFFAGVLGVWVVTPSDIKFESTDIPETILKIEQPLPKVDVGLTKDADEKESERPLDKIWVKGDLLQYQGYKISRSCGNDKNIFGSCAISIKKNGKILSKDESAHNNPDYMDFGLFDFLGRGDKQLIIRTYSGGSHCCTDYYIYDLSAKFRIVYNSSKYDSANEIGSELVPVDIDGDGIYEFYQDVMAFDYDGAGGHASASFPPAIFRFDRGSGRFDLATKRFPKFVLAQLSKNLTYLDKEIAENKDTYVSADDRAEYDEEYRVRETFLFWMYAGKREKAWEYFRNNYRSKISGKYMDEFREQFIGEFHETFRKDPTYLSIYDR